MTVACGARKTLLTGRTAEWLFNHSPGVKRGGCSAARLHKQSMSLDLKRKGFWPIWSGHGTGHMDAAFGFGLSSPTP